MISPGEIPQIPGDMQALAGHAGALTKVGGDFAGTGQHVNATWQGLAAFYRAPEAAQLFAATAPVQSVSSSVGEDIEAVGAALTTYATEVAEIKRQLAALQTQAGSFVDAVAGDDDWRDEQGKVDQHNTLIQSVNTQVAAFLQAQRRCANTINALYGGRQYRAEDGDGHTLDGEYGVTAEVLNAAAGQTGVLPWGSSVEHERGLLGDVGAFFGGVGEGFTTMLGDLGSLLGRDPQTGGWSWSTAGTAWTGVGTFVYAVAIYSNPVTTAIDHSTGMPGFERDEAGKLLLGAGKSLIAYDQWGQDNARAGGMATFNIVSAIVGTKGAGASLRGAGTAAQTIRGSTTVAQVSTGLIRAGTFIDNLPSTAQITTRIRDTFTIHIPTFDFGPIPAFTDATPGSGHRFDVEMPGPRGPDTFHMDTGSGPGGNGPGAQWSGGGPGQHDLGGNGPVGPESSAGGANLGGDGLGGDDPAAVGPADRSGDGPGNDSGNGHSGGENEGGGSKANQAPLTPQERQLFLDQTRVVGARAEDYAHTLVERQDVPRPVVDQAIRDFVDLQRSDRLASSSEHLPHLLEETLKELASDKSQFVGKAAELRAFQDVVNSGDLAPGSKIGFNAKPPNSVDLGNGTIVDLGDVRDADLVYQTTDGAVHLDEVKDTGTAEGNKVRDDPAQTQRMVAWRAAEADRIIGVRIRTDEGWTGLYIEKPPRGSGDYAINDLIADQITVKIGGYELNPSQLQTLRDATQLAYRDTKRDVPGKPADWFAAMLPDLAAAREFLRPYGVDFL